MAREFTAHGKGQKGRKKGEIRMRVDGAMFTNQELEGHPEEMGARKIAQRAIDASLKAQKEALQRAKIPPEEKWKRFVKGTKNRCRHR